MRRKIAIALPVVALMFLPGQSAAQTGSMRVTVPSPTAASLGKFGDIPVSLYTGVPDISIPLFTAKGKTLDLPIVLRYHAGGIRVEEVGGWVGIGWTLEAGGAITRTVRGLHDEYADGYYWRGWTFYDDAVWSNPPVWILDQIRTGDLDAEPDRFFFNFAGRSGQFVMGPTSTSPTFKEVRTIPYQKLRILEPEVTGGTFIVTTEDGTRYTFGAIETSTDYTDGQWGAPYPSSWHLTEIRAPGGDVITLHYTPYTALHKVTTYNETFHNIYGECSLPAVTVETEHQIQVQRLDSIRAAAHTIHFIPGPELRSDALSPTGNPQEPRLDTIRVTTPAGTVLRQFWLDHDYSTGRFTLKNVYERNRTGASLPPYSFVYSGPVLPAYSSFSQDHWGYYNGQDDNPSLLPTTVGSGGGGIPGADRSPDFLFMKAGVLTKITYPTGGSNQFDYEANDYGALASGSLPIGEGPVESADLWWEMPMPTQFTNFTVGGDSAVIATVSIYHGQPDCYSVECSNVTIPGAFGSNQPGTHYVELAPGTYQLIVDNAGEYWTLARVEWREKGPVNQVTGGGLRVAQIHAVDAIGLTTTRRYLYTLASDPLRSSGVMGAEPDYDHEYSSSTCYYYSRSSTSKMPLGAGTSGQVAYREVTVLHGLSGEHGTTRHTFRTVLDRADGPSYAVWPHATRTSYEWMRGQAIEEADYNAAGAVQGRVASAHTFEESSSTARRFRGMSTHSFSAGGTGTNYYYNKFEIISGWAYQNTQTTTVYDTTGTTWFSTSKAFTYGNPNHAQLTEVTETNSDGTQRVTRMKYPADYATGGGSVVAAALTAMQGSAHIHSPVIERSVIKRVTGAPDSVVQAELTSFKNYTASPGAQYLPYQRFFLNNPSAVTNFVPSSITSGAFTKDGRYLLQETANSYDATGRITRLTDARNAVTDYTYGGNGNNAFLIQVKRWKAAPGGAFLATDLAYDANGYVSSIKNEGGTFRYFTHDPFGRLSHVKRYDAPDTVVLQTFAYAYSRTSANGWVFDSVTSNRITTTTYLTPTVTSVVSAEYFDGLGRSRQTVVQDGSSSIVTATEYDAMGRPWRAWKPFRRPGTGYGTNFAATATDSANAYHGTSPAKPFVETQYRADALGRIREVIPEHIGASPPFAAVTSYGVESTLKQQITEVTDESLKKRRTFADVFDNTVKIILGSTAPESTVTHLFYNILGQRTKATDPRGLNTTYTLDTRGLLSSRTSPDAGTVNHKYDQAGNLRYTQDANQAVAGQVYFTTYDFANRPLVSGQATATFNSLNPFTSAAFEGTNANFLVVRKYDGKPATGPSDFPWNLFSTEVNPPAPVSPLTLANVAGRLAAVASKSNGAWQVTLFSYDADGHVDKRYTFTQANSGASVLTAVNTKDRFFRDLRGALTQRTLTVGSSAFHHWYDYDSRGLLWKVFNSTSSTKPATPEVTYTYPPSGQLQSRHFAGESQAVPLRYTIRDQLESIGDPTSTTYPFSARYTYHPNGTLLETEFHSVGSPATAKRYKYWFGGANYDALNRLKGGDFTEWSGGGWFVTAKHDLGPITYDRAGNLLTLQRRNDAGTLIDNLTYTIAAASNRLTGVGDAVDGSAETWDAEDGTFTYDANGNMKTAPGGPYLITTPITYDHQNLPLAITRSDTTTTYRYNDAGQRITKQVGTGNTDVYLLDGATSLGVFTVDGAGAVVSSYFNVLAGDRVVGRKPSNDSRRYYHTDLLGSTRAVVDRQTGAVLESYDFEPWGLLMPGRTLGSGTKEGFTGKEQDAETGLDYFGARYYMPALARWTAVDPLAEKHPEWSPYNYVLSNPLVLFDPDGRQVNAAHGAAVDPALRLPMPRPSRPWVPGELAARTVVGVGNASETKDLAAGFTPIVSTVQDATMVITGTNLATGEKAGTLDQVFALAGLVTPASGAGLRRLFGGLVGRSLRGADTWGNPGTLADHFGRHGGDFGGAFRNAGEYAQGASDFLKRSQAEGLPTKIGSDGTIRVYDPATNTFASYNPDGSTKTFFKPDPKVHGYKTNQEYWDAQKGTAP